MSPRYRNEKPPLAGEGNFRKVITWAEYHTLSFLQWPFAKIAWLIEYRKSTLQIRLSNMGGRK